MKFDTLLLFFILVIFHDSLAMDDPPGGSGRDEGERTGRNGKGKGKSSRRIIQTYFVDKQDFREFVQQKTSKESQRRHHQGAGIPGRHFRLMSGSSSENSQTPRMGQSSSARIGPSSTRIRLTEQPAEQSAGQLIRQPGQTAQPRLIENSSIQRPSHSRYGNPRYPVHENLSEHPVYQDPSGYLIHQNPSQYPVHQNPLTFPPHQNTLGGVTNLQFPTISPHWSTPRELVQQPYPITIETYRHRLAQLQQNRPEYQHGTQQDPAHSSTSEFQPDVFFEGIEFPPDRRS